MGFFVDLSMLEEAVTALKEGKEPLLDQRISAGPEIDLHLSALIPEDYVHDAYLRLTLYKRLASCKTEDDIANFKAEMIDRFGTLPAATHNLLKLTVVKLMAMPLGITKIDVSKQFGYIHFNEKPNVNPATIVNLIQQQSKVYTLQGASKLRFAVEVKLQDAERIDAVQKVLQLLTVSDKAS